MATISQSVEGWSSSLQWFRAFLREELAPQPGRAERVARMVASTTLVMIICMTFRLQDAFLGAVLALTVARENPDATVRAAGPMLLLIGIATAYLLVTAGFVISVPEWHLLWVIVSFLLPFFAISAMTNYGAASTFTVILARGIPLWDRHVSAETNVEDTLRLALAASLGVLVTTSIDLVIANLRRRDTTDDIVLPVAERLDAVASLLQCYASSRPVDTAIQATVERLEMAGTSRLRRIFFRSSYPLHYVEHMGAVVSLTGRLVNIAVDLTNVGVRLSDDDRRRSQRLADDLARVRSDLLHRRAPDLKGFTRDGDTVHAVSPLSEIESTVSLIAETLASLHSFSAQAPLPLNAHPAPALFVPDALSNVEHMQFALKGCLTASLCYIIYTTIDWPGINASLFACFFTALATIGSSRQKQILMFGGAVVGGFVISMGSQVFILPHFDSIVGFTVLFVPVTVVACWFMTSSPRLSYFGLQIAFAFYLVNLQEFAMQTSLAVARDRVVGILLGISMMWLVFDHLWGAPAAVDMKRTFVSSLRLLARFAGEPLPKDMSVAAARDNSLRETIRTTLDRMRALADGVLLEFGPSRQRDIALRRHIVAWGSRLRLVFITEAALRNYRLQLPGYELPQPIADAHRQFDSDLAVVLEDMAERLEGGAQNRRIRFEHSFEQLERTIRSFRSEKPQQMRADRLQTLLYLCRRIESVTLSVDKEI